MNNHLQNRRGFFITGSDTGVGKTWVGCQLLEQLNLIYPSIKVRKPVESGCTQGPDRLLFPEDGNALFKANHLRESLEVITPFRYSAALAPDLAARTAGEKIYLKQLKQAVEYQLENDDLVLVEGAGGFYSPIAEDGLNADLAQQLGLPVILVIEDRLGAINQALLAIQAIEHRELRMHSIILNQCQKPTDKLLDNVSELSKRTTYPIYQCNFKGTLPSIDSLIDN